MNSKKDVVVELHYIRRWTRMAPGLAVAENKARTSLASHRLLATLVHIDEKENPAEGRRYLAVPFAKKKLAGLWQRRLKKNIALLRGEPCYLIFKNRQGNIIAHYPAICTIPFDNSIPQMLRLKKLFRQHDNERINEFCRKLPPLLQQLSWRVVGDYFFERGDFKRAGNYYRRGHIRDGLIEVGRKYLNRKNHQQALQYLDPAGPSIWRAITLAKIAELHKTNNRHAKAREFYHKSVAQYEAVAADFHYHFTLQDNRERRRCIAESIRLSSGMDAFRKKRLLKQLLHQLGAYCDKLEKEYFMFFCHEVIRDYVDSSLEFRHRRPVGNIFVYDYQLLKEENRIREQRILLAENGEEKNLKNAPLFTNFQYENLVMGPRVLFGKNWQTFYDYRLKETRKVKGKTVHLIEAIPKDLPSQNALMAKIWVQQMDARADILKIAWNGKTIIKNFDELVNLEYLYGADLDIDFFLEFNLEKLGVRLPSRYFIEVVYKRETGERFVRSRSEVTFSNHKFFNVGTKVDHKNPEIKN
jgi:hypothetical protein